MARSFAYAIATLLLCGSSTFADNPPAKPTAESLAGDLVALSQLVLDHHFRPTTKQQVVLEAARGLYNVRQCEEPRDLAAQCSKADTDEKLRTILIAACGDDFGQDPSRDADMIRAIELKLNGHIPGGVAIESTKTQAANQQLAENRYVGTGIAVGMTEDHEFQVTSAIEGGPMHAAGVPDKTIIDEIEGWKTRGQRLEECVERLRGPKGTTVQMLIRRPGSSTTESLTIQRGVVPLKSVHARAIEQDGRTILHLQLTQITSSIAHETRQALTAHPGVQGLVIDLRETQPGPVHFAVLFADLFLDEVRLGAVWRDGKAQQVSAGPEQLLPGMPIAILVDESCWGSTEWLAAVLKETGRAEVFGTVSAGLAVDRQSYPLPSGERHATLATVILETAKSGKLLGSVSLSQSMIRPIPGKPPVNTIAQGRIYPQVEQEAPSIGDVVSNLFRPAQPVRGPIAIAARPPLDPLNAALKYIRSKPISDAAGGAQ